MIAKTNIGLYVLTIVLFVIVVISKNRIDYLEVKIENLNAPFVKVTKKDMQTEQMIKYQQFKEDTYIKHQEKDTNFASHYFPYLFYLPSPKGSP